MTKKPSRSSAPSSARELLGERATAIRYRKRRGFSSLGERGSSRRRGEARHEARDTAAAHPRGSPWAALARDVRLLAVWWTLDLFKLN
jgi:hypothetical protein